MGRDTLLVGCIYRSSGSSNEIKKKLNDIIIEDKNYHHTHFMLWGDFNYPNIVWGDVCATGSACAAESTFCEGLCQHVTLPTRAIPASPVGPHVGFRGPQVANPVGPPVANRPSWAPLLISCGSVG